MRVIGLEARLHPVSHLGHLPSIPQDENTIIRNMLPHQGGAKVMTSWVKPSFKYPILLFLNALSKPSSHVASTSLPSPSIMVGLILLIMWATLTKGWLFTPRIRLWCVRSSLQALDRWQWGGLTVWQKDQYLLWGVNQGFWCKIPDLYSSS